MLPAASTAAPAMTRRTRIVVIHNPSAGQRRRARYAGCLAALRALGATVEERPTTGRGDAERIAAEQTPDTCDAVVVAGGDGTIGEAVNGLLGSGGTALPLGIIPLGTANVLAAEIGLPDDPGGIARTVVEGVERPVCVGRVDGHRFIMMAGVGFDARVVRDVSPGFKRLAGKAAYAWRTAVALATDGFPRFEAEIDGTVHDVSSVTIANGHFYGGRFVSAPEARLHDRVLHAMLLPGAGRRAYLRYGVALTANRLFRQPDVRIVPFERMILRGPTGEPIQADGDLVGRMGDAPTTVDIDPLGCMLVHPRTP
jgi:diacylglycerol kinase (ATP)